VLAPIRVAKLWRIEVKALYEVKIINIIKEFLLTQDPKPLYKNRKVLADVSIF